jgi:hypothetical protein
VALGHHLRAHQHVGAQLAEGLQRLVERAHLGRDVAVQAQDARVGHHLLHRLGHPLGARAERLHLGAAAALARGVEGLSVAAVVAHQDTLALVVRERDRAAVAGARGLAGAADHHGVEAAAVEEDDRLLLLLHHAAQRVGQGPREQRDLALLGHLAQVHDLDGGHAAAGGARGQAQLGHAARLHAVAGLERGRGRAQHHHRAGLVRAVDSQISAVVAHVRVLLERGIVLLVHHHDAQRRHRRPHRRARPQRDVGLTRAQALPAAAALHVGHGRVQHHHVVGEARAEAVLELRGQRDLGHQHDRAAAARAGLLDGPQVHLGLARARHAAQQEGLRGAGGGGGGQRGQRVQLGLRGHEGRRRYGGVERARAPLGQRQLHPAIGHQDVERAAHGGAPQLLGQHVHRQWAVGQALQDLALRVRAAQRRQHHRDVRALGHLDEVRRALGRDAVHRLHQPQRHQALGRRARHVGALVCALAAQAREHGQVGLVEAGAAASGRGQRGATGLGELPARGGAGGDAGGQGDLQDLAGRRQVVFRGEAHQLQQLGAEQRVLVQALQDRLGHDAVRRLGRQRHHEAGELARAEGHQHAVADLQARLQLGRDGVVEAALEGQGDDDLGVRGVGPGGAGLARLAGRGHGRLSRRAARTGPCPGAR